MRSLWVSTSRSRSATSTPRLPRPSRPPRGSGVRVARHPADKDATDLELALDAALAAEPARVLVLAGIGERLDHLVSALHVLGSPRYAAVEIDARVGAAQVHLIRDERTFEGEPGELVSLLALHGPAKGVSTEGLEYPLVGETLEPGSSRGVSNRFVAGCGARPRRARPPPRGAARPRDGGGDVRLDRRVLYGAGVAVVRPRRRLGAAAPRRWRRPERSGPRHALVVRRLGRREAGVRDAERPDAQDPSDR